MSTIDDVPNWTTTAWQRRRSAELMFDLVAQCDELHKAGCFHRDLKPSNILGRYRENNDQPIAVKSQVKDFEFDFFEVSTFESHLADFSICRPMPTPETALDSSAYLTATIGEQLYAAPEIFEGRYDHRVDIYSLGIIHCIFLNRFVARLQTYSIFNKSFVRMFQIV